MDGDKFVCMDQILAQDQCVIYSFGLAADWTFEDQMDLLGEDNWLTLACLTNLFKGCKIFAYDHTINAPATRGKNIKYFKTGLGFGENLKPLSQLIAENEHQNTVIDYLKVCKSLFINKGEKHYPCICCPFSDWHRRIWIFWRRFSRLDKVWSFGQCESDSIRITCTT